MSLCYEANDCSKVDRLVNVVICYDKKPSSIDTTNILEIINDFGHAVDKHNDDNSFHTIYQKFTICYNVNCRYNHCNQDTELYKQTIENTEYKILAIRQILDKIHYYFEHSYDIGCRIRPEFCNAGYLSALKLNNSNSYNPLRASSNKFCLNQKSMFPNDMNNLNTNLYSFGFVFDYPYHANIGKYKSFDNHKSLNPMLGNYIGEVEPKFKDLKQELTS
eukprot:417382_1